MIIKTAEFVISNTKLSLCPPADRAEYAFIGRSNVGKSSLINYITGNKKLAKTSASPGKTQLINHFMINDSWYLVDLPGYGYAVTSQKNRQKWQEFIADYILKRETLLNLFVLIDSRLPAQQIDLDFMEWLGIKGIPFAIVFTKTDKLTSSKLNKNLLAYKKEMLKYWEEIPISFNTSATGKIGKEAILNYIESINEAYLMG
ncbi:MAG: YihA family ribosome biogenesis GTP-binding protein [Flavobacteriales bacterium CG_4_10_14_0_2_um_filter_32_8]|nr:MAG: YihA family ribosome biogenesis GTP-binding protein [Flavobacteriales bacterium CG_4_10_14_0_2_um_filter_32_8]PJB14641.1 MAG: YihA family ribosome biogenesis GTP-binding protein [Flavobacteriales bacterium CG_4_9_14_3_um_filter_32_8]